MMQMKLLMLVNVPPTSWQLLRYSLLSWQLCRQNRRGRFGKEGLLALTGRVKQQRNKMELVLSMEGEMVDCVQRQGLTLHP